MRWEAKYPFLAKIVDGLRFLGDLLAVNLLWLFTSLPIVTVGAASSAAYAVLLRYVREGDVPILKTYFQSLSFGNLLLRKSSALFRAKKQQPKLAAA